MPSSSPAIWEVYADVVLQRAALGARLRRGEPPRPLAGLVVDDEEIAVLLSELPGLAAHDEEALAVLKRTTDDDLDDAMTAFDASSGDELTAIAWNAQLDPVARRLFAIAVAIELDTSRQKLVGYVNDDVSRRWLTPAAIGRMLGSDAVSCVGEDSPLLRSCLADVEGDTAWALRAVRIAPMVVAALAGAAGRDRELPRGVETVEFADGDPGGDSGGDDFVLVHGGDHRSRVQRACEATAGNRFLVSPLPDGDGAWAAVVRQCIVGGFTPIIDVGVHRSLSADARWWIDRASCLPLAVTSTAELMLDSLPERPFVEHRCEPRRVEVGNGHVLDAEQAHLVHKAVRSVGGDLDAAVRRFVSGHLDEHAARTRPGRSWDELVLPAHQITMLRELVARYRHRRTVFSDWGFPARPSTGATALFSGPSGTGKTMTAEIIATELGLDLYRVDLSAVVSKYIGETEKNLEQIFTASGAGNLVLFFDEADALFGKRSEVSDAHDRYANIEVAYLLQRLESYGGFVILATNLRKNIDEAFARRIDVGIEFELPDEARRLTLWEQVFPETAPVGDIDRTMLAREFEVSGGVIRNAAVHAAFLAAEEVATQDVAADGGATEAGCVIETRHVLTGMQREFQKLGRLRSVADFERLASEAGGTNAPRTR